MRDRCVAVYDEAAVVLDRVEELMTDPEQIVRILLPDRNAGVNAGMDKQKISATEMIAQTLQKQFVCTRKSVPKAQLQPDWGFV